MVIRYLTISLTILSVLVSACSSSEAAGAYGHFIIASRVADAIRSGEEHAPADLEEALKDPECRKAFYGGAVAPDLVEDIAHYGKTGDLANAMRNKAQSNLNAARQSKDPKKIKEAQIQLAFSYGWLSHIAADINIHPLVNSVAGDAYKYCSEGQKAIHAAQEIQLDKFLHANYKKEGDKYAVIVPEHFLSVFVGLKPNQIRHNLRVLNLRVMGELASKDFVTLDNDTQLKPKWDLCVKNCINDSKTLIFHPEMLKNWDLDAGPISTEDFDALRELVKQANGGKLPNNWGDSYLEYYHKALELIEEEYAKNPKADKKQVLDEPDYKIPPMPKLHKQITEEDKIQLRDWRDKCVYLLNKQMDEDPLREANKKECMSLPRQNREMTCAKCGFSGVHWWIEPSWSCPNCEFCTMPQDVKRADGMTYREYAERRMKFYKDKIAEIESSVEKLIQ